MAELDKKLKITERLAKCFPNYRNLSYVDYSVHQLVTQRIYGLILMKILMTTTNYVMTQP